VADIEGDVLSDEAREELVRQLPMKRVTVGGEFVGYILDAKIEDGRVLVTMRLRNDRVVKASL